MKFKQVLVYTGYNENGIENVEDVEFDNVTQACESRSRRNLTNLLEDDSCTEEQITEIWEEFYKSFGTLKDGTGWVSQGEENVFVMIPETHELFEQITGSCYDVSYSDEFWNKWMEFMDEAE
jgi:hypothetical protein